MFLYKLPNGHTTSNRRGFGMDITSIRRRPNFDEFPRHSRVLFRCNFDGRKIHVVSRYFFRYDFNGRNMHVVFTCFSQRNFEWQKFDIVFGKLQANENIRGSFSCVCKFKQLTFARLLSLNFSSKPLWWSPIWLKFESCSLHHCKKNCCKFVFLVFTEQLLYEIIFERLHCYEDTLVKKLLL